MMESIGPELIGSPLAESAASTVLFDMTNIQDLAIFFASDDVVSCISPHARANLPGHFPSGTSFRVINHFRQLILKGNFQKYNFGFEENFKRYGQVEPPEYDWQKISKKVPIACFCGTGDLLSSPGDYEWTRSMLRSVQANLVCFKEYESKGHLWFLAPKDPKPLFNEYLKLLKQHNPYYKDEWNPYYPSQGARDFE